MDKQKPTTRRPSGFGTAGQASKARPMPEPEPETKKHKKAKPAKPKKEKKPRAERDPGKKHPLLRIFLIIITAIVFVCALMVLIFGGEDTTYHQMPTIERESTAQFDVEETPIPGLEGL